MVAGPEVAALIEDFQVAHHLIVNLMEELANPFEEESEDLLVIESKEIADPSAVEAVNKTQKIGHQQF